MMLKNMKRNYFTVTPPKCVSFMFGCLCTFLIGVVFFGKDPTFKMAPIVNQMDPYDTKVPPSVRPVSKTVENEVAIVKTVNTNGQAAAAAVAERPPVVQKIRLPHTLHGRPQSAIVRQQLNQKPTSLVPKYTLEELKQRAKNNATFLAKIMEQDYLISNTKQVLERYFLDRPFTFMFNETKASRLKQNYNITTDVIVFLHIQKTGGMHFNQRIDRELQKPFPCKCQRQHIRGPCNCLNPKGNYWFYNTAYSGWQCGLHADWNVMHRCVPGMVDKVERKQRQRRYFYFTQIRDGLERYMSEYHHQTAKNHWQSAILGCGDLYNANKRDVQPCFRGRNWLGVTLDNFMACKDNLATHRMTRMLADLTLAGCYTNFTNEETMKWRAPIWLKSAKENLQTMEYIGLMEDEAASDKMFKKTYTLEFKTQVKKADPVVNGAIMKMTETQFLKVVRLAELDIHLYLFGKDLFYKRLKEANIS